MSLFLVPARCFLMREVRISATRIHGGSTRGIPNKGSFGGPGIGLGQDPVLVRRQNAYRTRRRNSAVVGLTLSKFTSNMMIGDLGGNRREILISSTSTGKIKGAVFCSHGDVCEYMCAVKLCTVTPEEHCRQRSRIQCHQRLMCCVKCIAV